MPIKKYPGRRGGQNAPAETAGRLDSAVSEIDGITALFQTHAAPLGLTATWNDDPDEVAVIDPRALQIIPEYIRALNATPALQQKSGVSAAKLAEHLDRTRASATAIDMVEYVLVGAMGSRLVVLTAATRCWRAMVDQIRADLSARSPLTAAQQEILRVDSAEVLRIDDEMQAAAQQRRDAMAAARGASEGKIAGAQRQQQRLRALRLIQEDRAAEVDPELLDELTALYDDLITQGVLNDDDRRSAARSN